MTIQLNVTSELERKLKQAAGQKGLQPDTYILHLLQKDLQSHSAPALLPPQESKLLKKINASLSAIAWERYRLLLTKRDAEALNAQEQAELVALSNQIEAANARRMKAVAELARLRETSVPALMETLGLSLPMPEIRLSTSQRADVSETPVGTGSPDPSPRQTQQFHRSSIGQP